MHISTYRKYLANQSITINEIRDQDHGDTTLQGGAAILPRDARLLDGSGYNIELLYDRPYSSIFNILCDKQSQFSKALPDKADLLTNLGYLTSQLRAKFSVVERQLPFATKKRTRQRWERGQERKWLARVSWFTEWPNGQRPLSTTWPWNIRPSLVVLWGVCWMFYANVSSLNCMPEEELAGVLTHNDNNQSNFWGIPPQTLFDDQWLQDFNPSGHDVQQSSESHLHQGMPPTKSVTIPISIPSDKRWHQETKDAVEAD